MRYKDLFLLNAEDEIKKKAVELGWEIPSEKHSLKILQEQNWEVLKRKISSREKEILAVKAQDYDLNKKILGQENVDILLSPEQKSDRNSGIDHILAKKAAKKNIAIAHDFSVLENCSLREKSHTLHYWKQNNDLCKKYGANFIITTNPENQYALRDPKNLEILLGRHNITEDSLAQNQSNILQSDFQ